MSLGTRFYLDQVWKLSETERHGKVGGSGDHWSIRPLKYNLDNLTTDLVFSRLEKIVHLEMRKKKHSYFLWTCPQNSDPLPPPSLRTLDEQVILFWVKF